MTVVSGSTKFSSKNLDNLLPPICDSRHFQHLELAMTCGGARGMEHLRPVAKAEVQATVTDAVRAWPQAWVVGWVVWHILFGLGCWSLGEMMELA
jgi:hypothetical protein